jgi:hypothetical protein
MPWRAIFVPATGPPVRGGVVAAALPELTTLALSVLPAMPSYVVGLYLDCGKTALHMLGATPAGYLQAEHVIDPRRGREIEIKVDRGRGGFVIHCRIAQTYLVGGMDGLVGLEVISVTRRKPHRLSTRAPMNATARIEVVDAAILAGRHLDVRLIDLSRRGAAFLSEQSLRPGDELRLQSILGGVPLTAPGRVAHVLEHGSGRHRIGCEFCHQIDLPYPAARRHTAA